MEKLVHQRVEGEQEVANLDTMKMELDRQVWEAKNELEGIRLSYQKVAKDVDELKSKVAVPAVDQRYLPPVHQQCQRQFRGEVF